MSGYKYANRESTAVIKLPDIFIVEGARGWPEFQEWLAAGNTPEPFKAEAQIKFEMWGNIKADRDCRMDGGFKVEVGPDVLKWFHSDLKSRTQHLGLLLAGAAVPPIQWKTMDGSFVPMSQVIAQAIFQAAMVLDSALFTVAEQHKAAMEVSADPASYDFSTGWPEAFDDDLR
jgi:hypothetical protein